MAINTKKEIIEILILCITLFVTSSFRHGMNLHLNNTFSLDKFNKTFFINLFTSLLSIILVRIIFIQLRNNNKIKKIFNDNYLFESTIKSLFIMVIKTVLLSLFNNKNMFNIKWLQTVFLVISSSLLVSILFTPFIKYLPYSDIINDMFKSVFVTLILDFIVDLKVDKPSDLFVSAAGVVIGDLTETPLSEALESQYKPDNDDILDSA